MAEQRDKAASGAIKTNAGVSIIPSSKRADGSVRKAVKVRPGFVAAEDRVGFMSSRVLETANTVPGMSGRSRGIAGIGSIGTAATALVKPDAPELTAAQKKNLKRKEKKREAREKEDIASLTGEGVGSTTSGKIQAVNASSTDHVDSAPKADQSAALEKKLKALQKKMRQIQDLKKARDEEGKALDEAQLTKLEGEVGIDAEIKEITMKIKAI